MLKRRKLDEAPLIKALEEHTEEAGEADSISLVKDEEKAMPADE